jgi:uncharacterized protein YutE (UPF0331/DUF86 family)
VRDAPRPLPREIKVRLADLRRHYEALALALEQTSLDAFRSAARGTDPAALTRAVYPVERGFEVLCNYAAELAELGLNEAGLEPGDRPANIRLLERERVISAARSRRLRAALEARNALQHEYPDVRAAGTYEAAGDLVAELPGFLRDYVAWLRRLGFGEASS